MYVFICLFIFNLHNYYYINTGNINLQLNKLSSCSKGDRESCTAYASMGDIHTTVDPEVCGVKCVVIMCIVWIVFVYV